MKLLIVEDEPGLQLGLSDLFEEEGHSTRVCGEGKIAIEWLKNYKPDLVLLDLGLPDMDGTKVLQHLSRNHPGLPVLVLTARANDADIVLGFQLGAFDYVTKPYSPRVLLARVDALLRRSNSGDEDHLVRLNNLTLDFERYQAFLDGEPIHLTTREIDLLQLLYQHQGKPVSRNDILDEVWGMDSEAGPRTVDTHIALLRKKIEPEPDKPSIILSQRGIGYKLVIPV